MSQKIRNKVVDVMLQVLIQGRSLNTPDFFRPADLSDQEQPLYKEMLWGSLRYHFLLDFILSELVSRPIKRKDADLRMILILGLYQIEYMRTPDYAVVNECVEMCSQRGKKWAGSMVNGVLRNFLRQHEQLLRNAEGNEQAKYCLPQWLLGMLKKSWPTQWQFIAQQSLQIPPVYLRVNTAVQSRDDYLAQLEAANISARPHPLVGTAVELLQSANITSLPGFGIGQVSVQDASPQLAAKLLNPVAGERVLDACAAPGGKTAHLLQYAPGIELTALDVNAERLQRVEENLQRTGGSARLVCGDAASPKEWWDGHQFDAILLDVPCSATGVIRRNPDIRYHRQADDIAVLCQLQRAILLAMWPMLTPGGRLLYATCSVLPRENVRQMEWFCQQHNDAVALDFDAEWGVGQQIGRQVLSGESNMDGFYYALLQKQTVDS